MIWRRIKKISDEDSRKLDDRLSDPEVTWKDRIAMVLSAFAVILLPCAAVLGVLAFLIFLIFGAL